MHDPLKTIMEVSPLRQVRKEKGAKKTKWVLKLKFGVTWKAIKMASSSTMKHNRFHLTCASSMKQLSLVRVQAEEAVKPIQQAHTKAKASHQDTKSLLSLLQLPYTASDFIDGVI